MSPKRSLFKRLFGVAKSISQNKERLKTVIDKSAEKSEKHKSVFSKIGVLIRMLKAYVNGSYREIPWSVLVKIVFALLYFLLITDLVPDFIPGVGMVDDITVVLWVLKGMKAEIEKFETFELQK